MDTKKVGLTLVGISAALGGFLFTKMSSISSQGSQLGCYNNPACGNIVTSLNASHFVVGILAMIFSLGLYMFFFSKSNNKYVKEFEENLMKEVQKQAFDDMLKFLDENERKVLKVIKDEEGISQSSLRFRTNLSKATVSQILSSFEKKGIVKREVEGKTYSVYLTSKI